MTNENNRETYIRYSASWEITILVQRGKPSGGWCTAWENKNRNPKTEVYATAREYKKRNPKTEVYATAWENKKRNTKTGVYARVTTNT